ncbi:MAG TPA: ribosome-associated translation inhibitor RaiA [Firmicutes bacterium]|nr:ribosome-associated translation inhibitor RaiA [Bacillota bacterium]
MRLSVRSKDLELTESMREYLEKRLSKLDKLLDQDFTAQVEFIVQRGRHRVEVTMPLNGMLIRGEEEAGDVFSCIDLVTDKLERQIEKYKARFTKKGRPQGFTPQPESSEDTSKVVKVKKFAFKPMDIDEAILQMNLLGHDFFVFQNAETESTCVLYRRKDGNYGLIEPE